MVEATLGENPNLSILDPHGHHGNPFPGYNPPENQAFQKWDLLERPYRDATNSPREEQDVPFQHRRQAGYLRAQYRAGTGRMGSDRVNSSAHNYLGNRRMGLPYPPTGSDQPGTGHRSMHTQQGRGGRNPNHPPKNGGNNGPTRTSSDRGSSGSGKDKMYPY
jgi:hypothetical protein